MTAKPQIVIQEMGGAHNADLSATRARLIKGGSWKKQRIIVLLPAADMVPAKCALAWWNLAFPPNNGVVKWLCLGMEVGDAYSTAIEQILGNDQLKDWEYILSVEMDNCPPSDGVIRLVERMEEHPEFAAISGSYFTKGAGGAWQGWGDPTSPTPNYMPQLPDLNGGLVEVCGLGQGFCLYRLAMFKDPRLRKPWFKTLNGKDGQGISTQDLYFWSDARKNGYRCAVDSGCKVGHLDYTGAFGPIDYMW